VLYLVQRCDARVIFFERSCPEQRPRAALKPQEPHSSGPFTPGAPAPAARSSRVVELWSWSRGKAGQAPGAISEVGKAVLTLYPPLRPLSHNVNPRDGPQDISSRARKTQRSTWPVQSLALETHLRASAVLSAASSAGGTKRTRSCSPATLPSPRQADNFPPLVTAGYTLSIASDRQTIRQ
jgi:hypothetical protein